MSDHKTENLRVLIANERKDGLAVIAPIVVALGHEVIAREIEVADVGKSLLGPEKGLLLLAPPQDLRLLELDQRRGEERGVGLAADEKTAAALQGLPDLIRRDVQALVLSDGADVRLLVARIAHLQPADSLDEALPEVRGDGALDEESLGGDAELPAVRETSEEAGGGGLRQVRALEHDERVVPRELGDVLLHPPAHVEHAFAERLFRSLEVRAHLDEVVLADGAGCVMDEDVDLGILDELPRGVFPGACRDLDAVGRAASLDGDLDEPLADERNQARGLLHHGVPGPEGAEHRVKRHDERRVARREDSDHSVRLAGEEVPSRSGGELPRFEELQPAFETRRARDGPVHLPPRELAGLAALPDHQLLELGTALSEAQRDAAPELGALLEARPPDGPLDLECPVDFRAEVPARVFLHLADHLARVLVADLGRSERAHFLRRMLAPRALSPRGEERGGVVEKDLPPHRVRKRKREEIIDVPAHRADSLRGPVRSPQDAIGDLGDARKNLEELSR